MVKRRFSRRKRTYRRKRGYRRRRYMKKGMGYDQGVMIKLHVLSSINYQSAYGSGNMTINWGSQQTTGSNDYIFYTQSNEWAQFSSIYREMKIVGLKIRYIPHSEITTVATSFYNHGIFCSEIGNTLTATSSDGNLVKLCDYRTFKPSNGFKRYITCSKYYRKINENWIQPGAPYSTATSLIRLKATGYANGDLMGNVHVTYYVKLAGQRSL